MQPPDMLVCASNSKLKPLGWTSSTAAQCVKWCCASCIHSWQVGPFALQARRLLGWAVLSIPRPLLQVLAPAPAPATCSACHGPQASRFTVDDATRHMAFQMEILFRKMAPQPFPRGRRLEIVDLKGMTFRDVGSEWFAFAKTVRNSRILLSAMSVVRHRTMDVCLMSSATRMPLVSLPGTHGLLCSWCTDDALMILPMIFKVRQHRCGSLMLNCWHLRVVTEQVSVCAQLGLTMQAMYPERMYRCFIINAPSFFTMLWRVMDPLMTERVKKKISIFRTARPVGPASTSTVSLNLSRT